MSIQVNYGCFKVTTSVQNQFRQVRQSIFVLTDLSHIAFIIFQHTQQNQQNFAYYRMSHNHISLEQEFFNPANVPPQLHQLTPQNQINRIDMKILQTAIPSIPLNGHQLQREMNPNQAKFFEEYKRIFNISYNLFEEKKRMQDSIKEIMARIQAMDSKLNNQEQKNKQNKSSIENSKRCEQSSEDNRNKRSRRTAEEIQKKFQCLAHQCQRYYGSEGSLQQHIKLKHPQLMKRDEDEEGEGEGEGSQKSVDEYQSHSMPA